MALVTSRMWPERSTFWNSWPEREGLWRDRFNKERDWENWPVEWPQPREIYDRFRSNSDRWWSDWPALWPRFDDVLPRFTNALDRFDRKWRDDPFWRDLYPRWAEPIFKDGLDVKTHITNDDRRFAVEIDSYQFRPEELQVKVLDDTLMIEGRHEDMKDRDNYTKMYFVRKYQLPYDVDPQSISSSVDNSGRLMVEAQKRYQSIEGRERAIPIMSGTARVGSRSSSYSRDRDSGRGSANDPFRSETRTTTGYDPAYLSPKSNGYRSAFENRQTDNGGMRHEARREEFREVHRTNSHQAIPPPLSPIRTESRQSGGFERSFQRSASSSRNEFRSGENVNGEHLLRPAEEIGNQQERSIRINRS